MCIIYKYSNIDKLGLSAQKLLLLKVDQNVWKLLSCIPHRAEYKSSCCITIKVCKDGKETWLVPWRDSVEPDISPTRKSPSKAKGPHRGARAKDADRK